MWARLKSSLRKSELLGMGHDTKLKKGRTQRPICEFDVNLCLAEAAGSSQNTDGPEPETSVKVAVR